MRIGSINKISKRRMIVVIALIVALFGMAQFFPAPTTDASGLTVAPSPALHVSYGHVNAGGGIVDGSGDFTVTHLSTGIYLVNFKSGDFSGAPSIVVQPNGNGCVSGQGRNADCSASPVEVESVTVNSAQVAFGRGHSTNYINTGFDFIATGESSNPTTNLSVAFGTFSNTGSIENKGSGNWSVSSVFGGGFYVSFNAGMFSKAPATVWTGSNIDCKHNVPQGSAGVTLYSYHDKCAPGGALGNPTAWGFISVGPSASPNIGNYRLIEGTWSSSASIQSGSTGNFTVAKSTLWDGQGTNFVASFSANAFQDTPVAVPIPFGTRFPNDCAGSEGLAPNVNSNIKAGIVFSGDGSTCTYDEGIPLGASMLAVGVPPMVNGAPVSSNIPGTFNSGETKTTGTDGNPLAIVMKNTGNLTWNSDKMTAVAGSGRGTCQVDTNNDGVLDAPSLTSANVGLSCTVTYHYSSSQVKLQHISSPFAVNPSTASYTNVGTITHTVVYTPLSCTIDPSTGLKVCTPPTYTYNVTDTGSRNVFPNATTTFYLNSLTAPAASGTYPETWKLWYTPDSAAFGTPFVRDITVKAPVSATGTVTVTSENAIVTSTLVSADWSQGAFSGSVQNPCLMSMYMNSCSGTQEAYQNMPTGTYILSASSITHNTANYSLRSIQEAPVAQGQGVNHAFAFFRNLFRVAKADVVCGWTIINGTASTSSCPQSTPSLTIPAGGDVANFIILWNPVATIKVNRSTVSLTATDPNSATGQVTLSNGGSQGSTLDWNVVSNNPTWLRVTSAASGCLNAGGGATENCSNTASSTIIALNASSSGLSAGMHTGTVTISGLSLPTYKPTNPSSMTITVSLTVSAPAPPAISITSPPPTPVNIPVGLACSGGTGGYTWKSESGSPNWSSTTGSNTTVSYPQPGSYTVDCTDSAGDKATATVQVTYACTLTASQTTLVPPETLTLTWTCDPAATVADSCSITGSDGTSLGGLPVNSSTTVNPTQDVTYTLSCLTNPGTPPPPPQTSTVSISVQNPNIHEVGP